jgi:hypothetical protein
VAINCWANQCIYQCWGQLLVYIVIVGSRSTIFVNRKPLNFVGLRNNFKIFNLPILRLGWMYSTNSSKDGSTFIKTFGSRCKLRSIALCFWGWFKSWFLNGFDFFGFWCA